MYLLQISYVTLIEQLVDRGISLGILLQHLGDGHFLQRHNALAQVLDEQLLTYKVLLSDILPSFSQRIHT
jgi:hypothetical protein